MNEDRRNGRFGGLRGRSDADPTEEPDRSVARAAKRGDRPGYLQVAIDPGAGWQMIPVVAGAIGSELRSDRIRFVRLPEPGNDTAPDITLAVSWPGMAQPSGIEVLEVGNDRLMVVTRVAPPPGSARLSPEDLRGLDLITGPTGPHEDRILVKILGQPAYRPQVRHHFDDTLDAVAMLMSTDSFMVMPQRCTLGLPPELTVLPLGPNSAYVMVRLLVEPEIAANEEAFPLIVRIHSATEAAAHAGYGTVATVDLRAGLGSDVPGEEVRSSDPRGVGPS